MRKRNKAITIRLSAEELQKLKSLVEQSGQTIQKYIIDATLNGEITSSDEVEKIKDRNKILADIDKQLRGIGTNINQMACIANTKGILPSAEKLSRISIEIRNLRKEVDAEWQLTRSLIAGQNHMPR